MNALDVGRGKQHYSTVVRGKFVFEYDNLHELPTYDRLMHLHVTRCGGTAFDRILGELRNYGLMPIGHPRAQHLYYETLEKEYSSRGLAVPPAVVFIRNPWDWYVAFWCWVRAVDWEGFRGSLREYVKMVAGGRSRFCVSLTKYWSGYGPKAQYVCRLEHWADDIVSVFTDVGIIPDLITEEQGRRIISDVGIARPDVHPDSSIPKSQWEPLHPYREYYEGDEEVIALVAEMDEGLIERFNYAFVGTVDANDFGDGG